jgi:hypothetical protein
LYGDNKNEEQFDKKTICGAPYKPTLLHASLSAALTSFNTSNSLLLQDPLQNVVVPRGQLVLLDAILPLPAPKHWKLEIPVRKERKQKRIIACTIFKSALGDLQRLLKSKKESFESGSLC